MRLRFVRAGITVPDRIFAPSRTDVTDAANEAHLPGERWYGAG